MKVDKKPELRENLLAIGFEPVLIEKINKNNYNLIGSIYRAIQKNSSKWDMVALKDVVLDIKDGGTPSRKHKDSEAYFGGNINWCVVKDIKDEIYETKEKLTNLGLKKCSSKLWPIDSIIISLGATIGNVGIAKVPTATKQGLSGIIVDKNKILPQYLCFILQSKRDEINAMASGSTIKEIRPSRFAEKFIFPLPTITEQQKIIDFVVKNKRIILDAENLINNTKKENNNFILSLWE